MSFDVQYFWQLNKIGTDVICLDHHTMMIDNDGNPIVNDCPTAIVVNNQLSPNYKNKDFCGAGVTYRFCNILDDKLKVNYSRTFIDLAAIGNIGDVMFQGDPETRYIIVEGLKHIENKGIRALVEAQAYSLKERAVYPYSLTPTDVAFYISPLINAVVRVGTIEEKEVLFYAFIDPDRQLQSTKRGAAIGEIELAAEQAARVAKNVKARQDRVKEKAVEIIRDRIEKKHLSDNNLIIAEVNRMDGIPAEMTGLIAQNIVSEYHKPCFIVRKDAEGMLRGSFRNSSDFKDLPELKPVLEQTKLFEMLAGHNNAGGEAIHESNVPMLNEYMNTHFSADSFSKSYSVDYILNAAEDNKNLLYALASHPDYYGNGITEPTFVIEKIPLQHANIFVMGTNKDSIRISYNGIDYIKFKDTNFIEEILKHKMDSLLNVYMRANLNTWGGATSVQGFITDYELIANEDKYAF